MRFTRTELSPANKKQYTMAMGKKDIELLHEMALLAHKYTPNTREMHDAKRRLASIAKAFASAMAEVEYDSDEGDKLPLEERQAYKDMLDKNPMAEVNRLEIIDHRKCRTCHGDCFMNVLQADRTYKKQECKECSGMGSKGRTVIVGGPAYGYSDDIDISSSVQDQGRTLKLFIQERGK